MNNLILHLNNMARGKETCRILKEIRKQIAEANDIKYVTEECKHKGDCLGTCPKCEAELQYLEDQLNQRRLLGKAVVVAGVSLSLSLGAAASTPQEFAQMNDMSPNVEQIEEDYHSYKKYKEAKEGKYCICGKIISNKKKPMSRVYIADEESKYIAKSDINGDFEFFTDKEEITLTIISPGFETKELKLKKNKYDKRRTITLKNVPLTGDVLIVKKKPRILSIFKKNKYKE